MNDSLNITEARKALSDYHVACMGDDRKEIQEAEAKWNDVQKKWAGMETFLRRLVINWYNREVIDKAGANNA